MSKELRNKIIAIWNAIEDGEPDISTERLMHMTAQEAGVDDATVAEALDPNG